jgi:CDP-diacylglycerol--glycerol-3-phosphate 3-phosphatidyltransferase
MTQPAWFLPSIATLVLAVYAVGTIGAYAVRTAIYGRNINPRVAKVGGSKLMGIWLVDAFYWSAMLPGEALVALRVSPDALTWASLVLTAASGVVAAADHFSTAGLLLTLGAACDAFDGYVARKRGIGSDAGEMLDAVIDRYADAFTLIGLMVFYRFNGWAMLVPASAMVGSMLLSYVRAKAEAMKLELPGTVMRRHERTIYLVAALTIGPELSRWLGSPAGVRHPATVAVLLFVGLMTNYAAFQLLFAARRELVRLGRGPKEASK